MVGLGDGLMSRLLNRSVSWMDGLVYCGVILTSAQLVRALSSLLQGYAFCTSFTPQGW